MVEILRVVPHLLPSVLHPLVELQLPVRRVESRSAYRKALEDSNERNECGSDHEQKEEDGPAVP